MVKTNAQKKKNILVVGNWKMHPGTQAEAIILLETLNRNIKSKTPYATVVVCSPTLFMVGLQKSLKKGRTLLGAQDGFFDDTAPHTGETSVAMLKTVGVSHIIVGHSERRSHGEDDQLIAKKVSAVLQGGLTAIVCVGEKERDVHGDYFTFIEKQVKSLLQTVKKAQLPRLVIAYEPIWAISGGNGHGKTATPEDAYEMKLFIQKVITDTLDRSAVSKVRVLYGGSVNEENAEGFIHEGKTDGFLIGGASLKPADFTKIVYISDIYGN